MKLKTQHEKTTRPEFDAAASKLTKATDALAEVRAELTTAEADVQAHEALAETAKTKPKDWAHDGAELTATVTWFERMIQSKESAVAEAQAEHDAASRRLALARMQDRAEAIATFDRSEFTARHAAKLAPVAEAAWSELNALTDLESEMRDIARDAGIDNTEARYSVPVACSGRHVFDGIDLAPAGLTAATVETALSLPENPRTAARRELLAAEDAERRQTEREREAEAKAEWERNAPQRQARARFEQAHENWSNERLRRSRSMQSTADMGPEPIFSNPATW